MIEARLNFTYSDVEAGWRKMRAKYDANRDGYDRVWLDRGERIARSRDPRLLRAMERAVEILRLAQDDQMGRTQRDAGTDFTARQDTVPFQMFREAYRYLDEGRAPSEFKHIYAIAADLMEK